MTGTGAWEEAFKLRPDSAYLFRYRGYEAACRKAVTALREGGGLVLLTGRPGIGKSLLLRDLDTALRLTGYRVVLHARPDVSADDVHRHAAEGGEDGGAGAGRGTILLLDEASGLDGDALRDLVRLAAPGDAPPRLRAVLAALPGFALPSAPGGPDAAPPAVAVALDPVADDEVGAYIAHRLKVAGHPGPSPFSDEAVARIAEAAGGVPRLINRICGMALLNCRLDGTDGVSVAQIEAVLADAPELTAPQEPEAPAAAAESPPAAPPPPTVLPAGEPSPTRPGPGDSAPASAFADGAFRIEASWTEPPAAAPLVAMRPGGPAAIPSSASGRSGRVGRLPAMLAAVVLAMAGAAGAAVYVVSDTNGRETPATATAGHGAPAKQPLAPAQAAAPAVAPTPADPEAASAAADEAPAQPPDPPLSPAAGPDSLAAAGSDPHPVQRPADDAAPAPAEAPVDRADTRPDAAPEPAPEPDAVAAVPEDPVPVPVPVPPAAADGPEPGARPRPGAAEDADAAEGPDGAERTATDESDAPGDEADPDLEMTVTEMLNVLVRHGFAEVREIRRQNGRYVVEVLTRDLDTRVLEVDPVTRRVHERRPPADIRPGAQRDPTGPRDEPADGQRPF